MSTNARHPAERTLGLRLPDRYAVRGHIATGGMASVFCAEDRLLGRTVAIKVLSERFASDELAIRRFKREARAAARVSAHAHVVTIFDVGDTEDPSPSAFIVMEYLAGGTVAEALRGDSVTRSDARRWLREAGPALDHAHERGVVHRDIKPANFLLDRDRSLHVADFGIARLQSEDTITGVGELFGTAAYVAPEQALGREATSASDRYSLAVAAFELLTRGRPFTAPHFAAQARQHIEERPPRASDRDPTLPAAVDQVLWRGMAKDPEARYPTAAAFVQALEAALDGEQTGATGLMAPAPGPPRTESRAAAASTGIGAASSATGAASTAARAAPAGGPNVPPALAASSGAASNPTRPAGGGGRARHRTGRVAALGALAIVALGVAALIWLLPGGSSSNSTNADHASNNAAVTPPARPHKHHHTRAHKQTVTDSQSATSTAPPPPASTTATTAPNTAAPSSSTAPPSTAPPSPSALQLQGHDQMLAGTYPEAIATLRRALQAAPPGSLTYAYTLYDLGRSLLLSGDPNDAIGVLEQRLRIPNQTGVVRETLDQALRAAGQAPQPAGRSGAAPSGPGNGPGNGHGHGHGGGPGPSGGRGGGPSASNGNDDGGDSGNISGGVSAG
jgi:eukaryotic-like serine/threonine-protein kinase